VRRCLFSCLLLLPMVLLQGCLIIPTDFHVRGYRKNLDIHSHDKHLTGDITLEKVLLTLGEPDRISSDGTEIWYETEKVRAILAAYNASDEIRRHYYLILNFNKEGVLVSHRFAAGPSQRFAAGSNSP